MMKISKVKVMEKDSKDIFQYSLKNHNNFEVKILTLGGIITDILMSDKDGKIENVSLKWKEIEEYKVNDGYLGALIGRFSGRIPNGKVKIDGKEYYLAQNNNTNQLHGGIEGFDKKIWEDKGYEEDGKLYLELTYTSKDMEEGFPGNLDIKVTYSLDNENNLTINYDGICDKDTVLNMTNHVYLNLSGEVKEKITTHKMFVDSYGVLKLDDVQSATGKIIKVDNTPFDFRKEKLIGKDLTAENEAVLSNGGYDHCFLLNKSEESKEKVILKHEKSGRALKVYTDRPAVVIYSKNFLSNIELSIGRCDEQRDSICLETQNKPLGINGEFLEESLLKAGEKYNTTTTYRFYLEK